MRRAMIGRRLVAGLPAGLTVALVLQGCMASSQGVRQVGFYDLASERVSGADSVVVADASGFADLPVLVTVGVDGRVVKAQLLENERKLDPAPGLAAVRAWTFRPQIFEGQPVEAVGRVEIHYRMPEIAPDKNVAFPQGAPGDVEIMLERSGCFGSCPAYQVTIRGDGRVRFSSEQDGFERAQDVHRTFMGNSLLWPGVHETRIDPGAVADLVARFRAAHFMGLRDEYRAQITDNPAYVLTLRVGGVTKRVTDYVGERVGMPASVTALEKAVDALAGTARWVRGNGETMALLKADGLDFRSDGAAQMVLAVTRINYDGRNRDDARALILAAIAEGLDLSRPVNVTPGGRGKTMRPIGTVIAGYAADVGDGALFDEMARRGAVAGMAKAELSKALADGAGCSAPIARALVAAGADPKAMGNDGNALNAIRKSWGPCHDAQRGVPAEVARILVASGVPLEARDELGWTPLMGCDDPEVVAILLKAGANPNARDEEGTTPILSVDDDRVALLLLQAGADPRVKDRNGTVRDQAARYHWPATLAWLDAHGIR